MSSNQAYYLKEYLSLSGDTLVLKKHFRINTLNIRKQKNTKKQVKSDSGPTI